MDPFINLTTSVQDGTRLLVFLRLLNGTFKSVKEVGELSQEERVLACFHIVKQLHGKTSLSVNDILSGSQKKITDCIVQLFAHSFQREMMADVDASNDSERGSPFNQPNITSLMSEMETLRQFNIKLQLQLQNNPRARKFGEGEDAMSVEQIGCEHDFSKRLELVARRVHDLRNNFK